MFKFDASENPENPEWIPALEPGWHSGMAQGTGLGVMTELATATGDAKWLRVGDEILNSFRVPFGEKDQKGRDLGGFTRRGEDGVPWFEMYPTTPPTGVLNGQMEALVGLDLWARDGRGTDTAYARSLFNEAVPALEADLPKFEVDVQGGTLTSYDAVRGYESDPLRLTAPAGSGFSLDGAMLNGVDVTAALPTTEANSTVQGNLLSPVLAVSEIGAAVDKKWRSIGSPNEKVIARGGTVTIQSDTKSWRGIHQIVKRGAFTPLAPLAMNLDAKLTLTDSPKPLAGLSGRVAVYQGCGTDGKNLSLLYETQKPRGRDWTTYTMGFNAPPAGCDILVQLLTSGYGLEGTTVEYKNIELRAADTVGSALSTDTVEGFNDLSILDTPTVALSLTGTGTARLEIHSDGKWQAISDVTLTPGTATEIAVPERYTGRNLHYGYHENNVGLLGSLYLRANDAGFRVADIAFLRDYAVEWELMAPSRHGTVPPPRTDSNARSRMTQQGPDLDSYELPLVDPFQLFMEE